MILDTLEHIYFWLVRNYKYARITAIILDKNSNLAPEISLKLKKILFKVDTIPADCEAKRMMKM